MAPTGGMPVLFENVASAKGGRRISLSVAQLARERAQRAFEPFS